MKYLLLLLPLAACAPGQIDNCFGAGLAVIGISGKLAADPDNVNLQIAYAAAVRTEAQLCRQP